MRIIVFGEADLSGEFELDSTGVVALPLIGEINANGIHARALETRIEGALRDGYLLNPQVSAEIIEYRPFYILGEVEQPGEYPYVTGMTIVKAIALAGGYTPRANRRRVFVQLKGEGQEIEKPADESVRVSPGDVLRIPESFF
ncbi:Capsule polysaccharide export protein [Candidatus Phaeomarinobacter ectocarpi]|uniref:Capsule polysaccharide export protein n=1 Tax=Candidatus Phaeomarinibacter ectocarpi TaxID=1458461 RepID=X5MCD5_9HYPH|nr:Capsule polysaccharide export protein [Candidatus Phaeomarinobacter ectocarpi]